MYVDMMLPFGLRSAPKNFTAMCIRQREVCFIAHYLDDFMTFGPPGSSECQRNVQVILDTCKELGVPLADEKQEGPTTKLMLLSTQIDTEEATPPPEKLLRLQQGVVKWVSKKSRTHKDLESKPGTL